MLLKQLEGFVEVARAERLGQAAGTLFITQPALTARIQRLEQELGAPLFLRTPGGMRLTDPGRAFLPYAVRALDAVEEGTRLVGEFARGAAGQLALGAAPAVSTYVLPMLLKRFAGAYPKVRLTVRTGHSEEVLGMVLMDEVELGIVRALRHPGIQSVPLYEERLVLVVNPEHPFAARGKIRVDELAEAQLILFDRASSYHDLTATLLREAGVTPHGVMELDNIDATKKMVQQGLGVALLPQSAVAAEVEDGSLEQVTLRGVESPRRQIVAIRRRDVGEPTGLVESFMSIATESMAARTA
ncbi:MAG TPA: LysR family transcriptional regulator [Gaiellaceae bacterium]|jgi:DNA-binding transcriptional LysR family regulator